MPLALPTKQNCISALLIHLGRFHIRKFQFWAIALELDPMRHVVWRAWSHPSAPVCCPVLSDGGRLYGLYFVQKGDHEGCQLNRAQGTGLNTSHECTPTYQHHHLQRAGGAVKEYL